MRKHAFVSPFGTGWVVFDGDRLVETVLPGLDEPSVPEGSPPDEIRRVAEGLSAYFSGAGDLPSTADLADFAPTPFLRDVYRVVAAIPPGARMTYGEVASAVGRPGAARAVGSAMARNPLAPIIPCHRVVPAGGRSIGRYGGGADMKRRLLDMEARVTEVS